MTQESESPESDLDRLAKQYVEYLGWSVEAEDWAAENGEDEEGQHSEG
jgi:hypothetical protein